MNYLQDENFIFEHKTSHSSNKKYFLNHMHNEWELYYFIQGNTQFFLNGVSYQLQPNDLFIIPPAMFHFATPKESTTYERIVIDFPESVLPQSLTGALKQLPLFFNISSNEILKALLEWMSHTVKNFDREDSICVLKNLLTTLLIYLKNLSSNNEENGPANVVNELLKDILDYIDKNLTLELTLESLSKMFFISPSTLSHTFKKHLNITTKQYINYKKILYAQSLIRSGLSATETSIQLNFNNYSTFFRLYKQYLHVSPETDKQNSKNQQQNKNG